MTSLFYHQYSVPAESQATDDECTICMFPMTNPKTLPCSHRFCKVCIDEWFKKGNKVCPVCKAVCGKVTGNQPSGTMQLSETYQSCSGYEVVGSIVIKYEIPPGIQQHDHPHPGIPHRGARRTAYLPNNREGRQILKLLQQAFDQRLIFTVGRSMTRGQDNRVTWNDIHHKTSLVGGPERYGYPDATYLDRVKEELRSKGITG